MHVGHLNNDKQQGGPKSGPQTHGHYFVKYEPILKKITGRFLRKFVVKRILKMPLHLAYVATLPCETLMSAKQTINDKLQGSVPTQARCGGNFIIHLTTNLPRNFQVKIFKSVQI